MRPRGCGSGLGLAKLADPDGIPDRLVGDFVEQFFALALERQRGTRKARAGRQ
jgi:hypothetical protein